MSTPRLLFLYPSFARSVIAAEDAGFRASAKRFRPRAAFSTGPRRRQGPRPQRYGTANEPPPHLGGGKQVVMPDTAPREVKPKPADSKPADSKPADSKPAETEAKEYSTVEDKPAAQPEIPADKAKAAVQPEAPAPDKHSAADNAMQGPSASSTAAVADSQPLETVLQMPSPAEHSKREKEKPPELQTPPYVHHFDSFGLVKDLERGGFTQEQSVTIMKAVRLILADSMELAQNALVSKSDVENESYLFRAACAELRTEVKNNRKATDDEQLSQRSQLQHEVDILNQKMTQESLGLKDELKGMFDDRKMAVRMEQRTAESKIQELNSKITVTLNSDARSDVEGLRWVVTRRAVIGLLTAAFMTFGALRYYSYMTQMQDRERQKLAKALRSSGTQTTAGPEGGSSSGGSSASPKAPEEGMLVSETGGQGYVSLG